MGKEIGDAGNEGMGSASDAWEDALLECFGCDVIVLLRAGQGCSSLRDVGSTDTNY